jgi:Holliday junction resolvase
MGNKEKGANVERELYRIFTESGYRAVRVAGSGMAEETACDLIAGKKGKKYCVEVKASKKPCKYISKEQINDFMVFSEIFKLKPVIAVKFNREGWFFLNPRHLEDAGKNWKITLERARKKGKRFGQAFS